MDWTVVGSLGGTLLGGLGAGSIISQYANSGKARRELRSAVLEAIVRLEQERWAHEHDSADYPKYIAALRGLETAALVARIPRDAVLHYVVFADTARRLSEDEFREFDDDLWAGPIDGYFDNLVRDSARLLTTLVWSPWRSKPTRWTKLRALRKRGLEFDGADIRWRLAAAQKAHGALPGKLGRIPGIQSPPQIVKQKRSLFEKRNPPS